MAALTSAPPAEMSKFKLRIILPRVNRIDGANKSDMIRSDAGMIETSMDYLPHPGPAMLVRLKTENKIVTENNDTLLVPYSDHKTLTKDPSLDKTEEPANLRHRQKATSSRLALANDKGYTQQSCRICNVVLKGHENFIRHCLNEHPEVNEPNQVFRDPWRCMHCSLWFDGPRRLSHHVKTQHKSVLNLKNAMTDQLCAKPRVQCKLCGVVLNSNLAKHTIKAHGHEMDIVGTDVVADPRWCTLCNKLCRGEQGLRRHLYRSHGAEVAKRLEPLTSASQSTQSTFPWLCDALLQNKTSVKDLLARHQQRTSQDRPTGSETFSITKGKPKFSAGEVSNSLRPIEVELCPDNVTSLRKRQRKQILDRKDDQTDDNQNVTYCIECKLELAQPKLYFRHVCLRHRPTQCPLCFAWFNGQIGLEAHDDSKHQGAVKLFNFNEKMA